MYLRDVLGIGPERQLHIFGGDEETGTDERVTKRYVDKLVGLPCKLYPATPATVLQHLKQVEFKFSTRTRPR